MSTVKHKGVSTDVKHSLVGPIDDPYARVTYTAEVNDHYIVLTCCALEGNKLEVDGAIVVQRHHGDKDGDKPIEAFELVVGLTVDEICEAYTEYWNSDSALEALDAERAAGWDPSP